MLSKQRVVLIGGTGFIGESLVKNLNKRNDSELFVIYKNSSPEKNLTSVNYYQIDVANEYLKIKEIIKNIDCLVILSQPDMNVLKNIIDFSENIKKIIYASTLLLYPDSTKKQNEDSTLEPINEYEECKLQEEKFLIKKAYEKNFKLAILRLTNIYGDIKNRGIVQKIFSAILNNKEITINGDGTQLRDYLFIDDVVNWLTVLIYKNQLNQIEAFNICSGEGHRLNEVISEIEKITRKKLKRVLGESIREKSVIIGDNSKIVQFTGKKPQFNLKQGLLKTYQNNLKV